MLDASFTKSTNFYFRIRNLYAKFRIVRNFCDLCGIAATSKNFRFLVGRL